MFSLKISDPSDGSLIFDTMAGQCVVVVRDGTWKNWKLRKAKLLNASFILQPTAPKSVAKPWRTKYYNVETFSSKSKNLQDYEDIWKGEMYNIFVIQTGQLPTNTWKSWKCWKCFKLWILRSPRFRNRIESGWLQNEAGIEKFSFSEFSTFSCLILTHWPIIVSKISDPSLGSLIFDEKFAEMHLTFLYGTWSQIPMPFSESTDLGEQSHPFWCKMVPYLSDRTLSCSPVTLIRESCWYTLEIHLLEYFIAYVL